MVRTFKIEVVLATKTMQDQKAIAKGENEKWQQYSQVYDLMDMVPYVKSLRDRHVAAMGSYEFILDAGCGTGLISRDLASQGKRVFGIDINKEMLDLASHRLREFANVRLYQGNVLNLPFEDNTFDGCVSNNVLHFIADSDTYFSELVRIVKPGGVLSIASARSCCDMEILIEGIINHYSSQNADEDTMGKLRQIAQSNRSLMKNVKTMLEPKEVSSLLTDKYGCRSVLYKGTAYLDQSFHVIVKK